MLPARHTLASSSSAGPSTTSIRLLWDRQDCIPLRRILTEQDIILLLSPVVVPLDSEQNSTTDPFEPFGLALAARHPLVRHVTYTRSGGITGIHVAFIRKARVVIFVVSGLPGDGEPSQTEFAEVTRVVGGQRPLIILACCDIQSEEAEGSNFPTVIQIPNYSPPELRRAAALLFGESAGSGPRNVRAPLLARPRTWTVEVWEPNSDVPDVQDLWCQSVPPKFGLSQSILRDILKRDGYAMHYVVRRPGSREVIGFCATYTTYADSGADNLVGSLALVMVRPEFQAQGVGLSLHNHALKQLKKTRGVSRLQLGTTFPRLLYGLLSGSPYAHWFARRGWDLDGRAAGRGQEACDWLLKFEDLPQKRYSAAGLSFRPCGISEFQEVLDVVERESVRKPSLGWYDQYAKLANTVHERDIILALEGTTIVAVALTYTPDSGSPMAGDLPWAKTVGDDVGGVTCICIADDKPEMVNSRDSVMIRLLDACVRFLGEQGMRRLFIDSVKGGDEGFQSIGFQKWASYRDVWQRI